MKMNSTNIKILLVEDDLNFGNILRSYLELNDFKVELRIDGKQAWATFMREKFDICILDVMMPEMDGFSLAREIRTVNQKIPIIFLTAKSLREDMIEGFQAGGDDYITKPFDSEVLLYRIRAILRRGNNENNVRNDHFQIGRYQFNSRLRILKINETEYKLTPKESELLKMLCLAKDDLLLRKEALLKIWGDDNYFTTRSMDVFIAKLRKYLKDDPEIEILSVHGNGYQLVTKRQENNEAYSVGPAADKHSEESQPETSYAIFAGGCFWGVEYYLQKCKGVIDVESGYTGGHIDNPSYEQVCSGTTGHYEAVKVTYDTSQTSFETLARMFFEIHDPTHVDHQGPDYGQQYKSAVFYGNEEEKQITEKLIGLLKDKGLNIVTEVHLASVFWKAEDYHQDYYENKGSTPYCHGYVKRF